MLRAILLLSLILAGAVLPGAVSAGPWLREAGTGYLSFALTLEDADAGDAGSYGTFYAEYGLRADLTLGLDAGTDEEGHAKALAFAVLPLGARDAALKLSAEIGLGVIDGRPVVRPGLAAGRGITLFGRSGWVSWESRWGLQVDGGQQFFGNDLTLGLEAGAGRLLMVQLQQGGPLDDSDYLRLVPAMVIEAAPGRQIEIGLTAGLKSASDVGLKLALWQSF